jgi:hypothetical protein
MKVISISLALLLAGCAANSGVMPMQPATSVTTPSVQAQRAARPAAAPPVQSQLTSVEYFCQWLGEAYWAMAGDRDRLRPITAEIDDARQYAGRSAPNDPTHAATLAEWLVYGVRRVYANPDISPAKMRYLVELQCMTPPADPAPAASGTRY